MLLTSDLDDEGTFSRVFVMGIVASYARVLKVKLPTARLFPAMSSMPCRILTRYQREARRRRTGSMEIVLVALS